MTSLVDLPRWLAPIGEFHLVRLGRDRDGGYLVDSRDVADAEVLVSLGVNDDWSFEADFVSHNAVPVHAFDGTIDQKILGKRLIKSVLSGQDVKHRFSAWRDYGKFFSGSRSHHKKMVGLEGTQGFLSMQEIFDGYANENAFLKIDIEGWEYRVLDSIVKNAHRLTGLVIEFHNVDLHGRVLKEFVDSLPLRIAHVHRNTYAPVSDGGVPLVLEVSFSAQQPTSVRTVQLPHPLDKPSSPDHEQSGFRLVD